MVLAGFIGRLALCSERGAPLESRMHHVTLLIEIGEFWTTRLRRRFRSELASADEADHRAAVAHAAITKLRDRMRPVLMDLPSAKLPRWCEYGHFRPWTG